jgi:hypothetical protein
MGGLAGADAKCQARANAANLPGTYMAWLSTQDAWPASRFTHWNSWYVRVDGVKVADNWADLTDGSLDAPINKTELNGAPPEVVFPPAPITWSNTTTSGHLDPDGNTCGAWTNTGNGPNVWGDADRTNSGWCRTVTGGSCGSNLPLYCFQQ